MHDAQPPVARLDDILESLGALVGGRVRLWRFDGRELRIAGGPDPGWRPTRPRIGGEVPTPTGATRLDPLEIEGYWVETSVAGAPAPAEDAARVRTILALLGGERQRALLAEELATRYQEIDLLYLISELLGRTPRLEDAAQTILREVSEVVGAGRASIMVHDERADLLRTVAARGFDWRERSRSRSPTSAR